MLRRRLNGFWLRQPGKVEKRSAEQEQPRAAWEEAAKKVNSTTTRGPIRYGAWRASK